MNKKLLNLKRLVLGLCLALCSVGVSARVYLNETFNSLGSGIPKGWSSNGDIADVYKFTAVAGSYDGNCLRFDSHCAGGALCNDKTMDGKTDILFTPTLEVEGNVIVSFYYRNPAAGDFAAYVSRDNGSTYLDNVIVTPVTGVENWTLCEVAVAAKEGDKFRVVFVATSNAASPNDPAYIYLDDVKVEDVPTCARPINLAVSEATPSTATLSWTILANAGTAPSFYTIDLYANNTKVRSEKAEDVIHTLENLAAGTTYTAIIQGDCTYDYQLVSPSASLTFTTPCEARAIPYLENFDAQSAGTPACWFVGGNHTSLPAVQKTYAYSGSALRLSSSTEAGSYAAAPLLHVTDMEKLDIAFRGYATNHSQTLEVGVMTNPYDFSTYVALTTVSFTAKSWVEYAISTAKLADAGFSGEGDIYIVLNAEAGDDNTVYVDELNVTRMAACGRPEDLKVKSVSNTEAVLEWFEPTTPVKRMITLVEGETTKTIEANANPFTLTGLTPNTKYTATVHLECAEGTSLPSTQVSFTTVCEPTTLEGVYQAKWVNNQLPECWTATLTSLDKGNGKTYPICSNSALQMKGKNLVAVCGFGIPANTLRVTLTAAYTPAEGATEMPMDLEVGIMTNPGDASTFVLVESVLLSEANQSVTKEVLLNTATTEGQFIALRATDACNVTSFKVDVIPNCLSPLNVHLVKYDSNSATIAWEARGNATEFKVEFNGETVTVKNATEAVFTNLLPGTSYSGTVTVTPICDGEEGEVRTGNVSFKTLCNPITITVAEPYSVSPGKNLPDCWVAMVDGNDGSSYFMENPYGRSLVALPTFTNSLSELQVRASAMIYGTYVSVGYVTSLSDPNTFVEVGQFQQSDWDYLDNIVAFPKTGIPAGVNIAFKLDIPEGYNSVDASFNSIVVELQPNCASTVVVENHESTDKSISISLGRTQGESAWEVICVATGSNDGDTVTITQPNYTFTNLKSGTNYKIYVRPLCGDDSISEWADAYDASTLCEEKTIPYLYDFSTGISSCYTKISGSWGNNNGGASLSINSTSGSAALATEGITIPEGILARLSFSMTRTADQIGSGWRKQANNNFVRVYVNDQPSLQGATMVSEIYNSYKQAPVEDATGTYTYTATIQRTGKVYFIFEQTFKTSGDNLVIDDIRLEKVEGCYTPFVNSVYGQTTTTANVKAQGPAEATEYYFVIGTDTVKSETNVGTFTGLTADTQYSVKVLALCNGELTEASAGYTFRTRCNALPIPYEDGFEAGTNKDCWIATGTLGTSGTAFAGSGALLLNEDATYFLPELEMTGVKNYELSFMVYGPQLNNQFNVGVISDPSDAAAFTTVKVVKVKEKEMWREVIVTFEDVPAGHENDRFIGITLPMGQSIVIDNVKVQVKPACQKVTNLDVTVYGDELAASWESKGEKTQFTLYQMGKVIKDTLIVNEATKEVQTASLFWVEPNSYSYNLVARSVCGKDSSEWTMDFEFDTPCLRMALPYKETFENLGVNGSDAYALEELLPCWNRLNVFRNGSTQIHPSLKYDASSKQAIGKVSLNMWGSGAHSSTGALQHNLILLPEFEKPVTALSMTFMAYCNSAEGTELEVIAMKNPAQPDDYQVVRRVPKVQAGFFEFEVHFTGYEGRYIGFRAENGVNFFLDNIEVTETPKSLRPTGLTATAVSEKTADLIVTDESANTAWEIILVPAGSAMDESKIQTFTQKEGIVYTGLTGGNIYDAYVRGVNGDAKSKWVPVENLVRTDCASGAIRPVFAETFEEAIMTGNSIWSMYISDCWTLKQIDAGQLGSGTDHGDDAWSVSTGHVYAGKQAAVLFKGAVGARTLLISPKLQILEPNAYEVSFQIYRQDGSTKDREGLRLWVNTSKDTVGGTLLTYVPHYIQTTVPGGVAKEDEAGFYEYTAVIPMADNALYVIFEGITQGGADLYIDNIIVRPLPSCRRPDRVVVAASTPSTVTLDITDPIGSAWDVAIMKRDSLMSEGYEPVIMKTVTTKNPTIEGLVSAESYDIYVRTNCGNEVSEWTRRIKFLAPCEPLTVTNQTPFTENWEGFDNDSKPTCWTPLIVKKGTTPQYDMPRVYNYEYYAPEGSKTMIMQSCMIASPQFSNDIRSLNVAFTTRGYYNIEVGAIVDPNDLSTYTPIVLSKGYQSANVGAASEVRHEVSLASYAGPEAHYITFRNLDATTIYFDLLEITLADPCFRIDGLTVTDITPNSGKMVFSDPRTQFDYAIVEAGKEITAEAITTGNNLYCEFTGLFANTTYDVYVRPYCEGEPGPWSKPVSFTTPCDVETVTAENPSILVDGPNQTLGCYTLLDGTEPAYYTNSSTSGNHYRVTGTVFGLPTYTNDLADLEVEVVLATGKREFQIGMYRNGQFVRYESKTPTANYEPITFSLSQLAGEEGQPAVYAAYYSTTWIRTLKVKLGPGFYTPILSADEVLDTKATITANAGRDAKSYTWTLNGEPVEGTSATMTFTGLTPLTTYTVGVKANDGTTDSQEVTMQFTTQDVIPVTPAPVVTAKATETTITATATVAEGVTAVEYAVIVATATLDETMAKTAAVSNGTVTFTESDLTIGTEYKVYVRAVGADKSYWTIVNKRTMCQLGGLPYAETFNTYNNGVSTSYPDSYSKYPAVPNEVIYPECWNIIGGC